MPNREDDLPPSRYRLNQGWPSTLNNPDSGTRDLGAPEAHLTQIWPIERKHWTDSSSGGAPGSIRHQVSSIETLGLFIVRRQGALGRGWWES